MVLGDGARDRGAAGELISSDPATGAGVAVVRLEHDPAAKTTRAQRVAMPLARQVVQDLAVEHGACIRPIQLRRTNLDTGEADTVLVPCGHTLAHVCPACAERAKSLRAAQCREDWYL